MNLLHTPSSRSAAPHAFTIIEIALCLGIIGFALVAIIAVLPRGLDVQKRNREETIIGQDSEVWMSAIRNGARGYNDLTNYVLCITNFWSEYDVNRKIVRSNYDYYTPTDSRVSSIPSGAGDFPLTNGGNIIGLLSMPKRGSQGSGPLLPRRMRLIRAIMWSLMCGRSAGRWSTRFRKTTRSFSPAPSPTG